MIQAYVYDEFMIYRAEKKFSGDISDPEQFITNYMNLNDPMANEKFIKNRYVPYNEWLKNFPTGTTDKIKSILTSIIAECSNHFISYNENNKNLSENIAFHIYGADIFIDEYDNIKILEINGAPSMNDKTAFYRLKNRLNHFDLVESMCKIVIDPVFEPKYKTAVTNKFKLIHQSYQKNLDLPLYYISNSISKNYPFIESALKKRDFFETN